MQYFYDSQIRRYLTQMVRMLSGFKWQSLDGKLNTVPVIYGDMSKQVAMLIKENSESKAPTVPKIAVYISSLDLDKSRLSDSTFVSKVNVRERKIDPVSGKYLNEQGFNYTVERLMPTPYSFTVKADIWTANTDQKLQILEQILMLFNPSLEIQTTDNYLDWTSLSVVYLSNVNWSSRSVPQNTTENEIDVATLTFDTPIWISVPAKVKKLGVITSIITNIFDESNVPMGEIASTPGDFDILVWNGEASLIDPKAAILTLAETSDVPFERYGLNYNWAMLLDLLPFKFKAGVSQLFLRQDNGSEVVGTVSINPLDENKLIINFDKDTFPTNTLITSQIYPAGYGYVDAIVDPLSSGPARTFQLGVPEIEAGIRYLILNDIGKIWEEPVIEDNPDYNEADYLADPENYKIPQKRVKKINGKIIYTTVVNEDGADAWKNSDGSDFITKSNNIIEWDGAQWVTVFNSETTTDITYVTNLKTGIQYKWSDNEWTKSVDGEYFRGKWRLVL